MSAEHPEVPPEKPEAEDPHEESSTEEVPIPPDATITPEELAAEQERAAEALHEGAERLRAEHEAPSSKESADTEHAKEEHDSHGKKGTSTSSPHVKKGSKATKGDHPAESHGSHGISPLLRIAWFFTWIGKGIRSIFSGGGSPFGTKSSGHAPKPKAAASHGGGHGH